MTRLALTVALATAGCAAFGGEWRQESLGDVVSNQNVLVFGVQNTGPSTIWISAHAGQNQQLQKIFGNVEESPPTWDSRFTPIGTGNETINWSVPGHYLDSGWETVCYTYWTKATGWQTFRWFEGGEPTMVTATRERDPWWEPRSPYHSWWSEPFTSGDPPGDPGGG
jgi:hypothetical protein